MIIKAEAAFELSELINLLILDPKESFAGVHDTLAYLSLDIVHGLEIMDNKGISFR